MLKVSGSGTFKFNSIVSNNDSVLVVYECSADMLEADAGSNKIVNILVAKGSPISVHFGILGAKVSLAVVHIKLFNEFIL